MNFNFDNLDNEKYLISPPSYIYSKLGQKLLTENWTSSKINY